MKFIRLTIQWNTFERTPPIQHPNGTWVHNYSTAYLGILKNQITWAAANGLYVLIENSESEEYPPWLMQAQYNSHGINYTDQEQWDTDYWDDPLLLQFTQDFLTWLAGNLVNVPGIVGYEVIDEPDSGYLPQNHETTQKLLDQSLAFAQAVRAVDPPRVIFFMTRLVHGDGLVNADLSGWNGPGGIGNVALDVHDYWGGRANMPLDANPSDPGYGEVPGGFVDFTLTFGAPPYIGTEINQQRFVQSVPDILGAPGTTGAIPLCMCEAGINLVNTNIPAFFATVMSAYNQLGVSWSVEAYNGPLGVMKADGSYQPWLPIFQSAGAY